MPVGRTLVRVSGAQHGRFVERPSEDLHARMLEEIMAAAAAVPTAPPQIRAIDF